VEVNLTTASGLRAQSLFHWLTHRSAGKLAAHSRTMSVPIHCLDGGAELPVVLPRGLWDCALKGTSDLEGTARCCRRKAVIATLTASVVLVALVGLAGGLVAQENGSAATDSDKKRPETPDASDAFLAERALTDTNLSSVRNLLQGLQEAIERRPTNAVLWRSRAVVLVGTGDLEGVLAHFSRAIELASTNDEKLVLWDALLRRRKFLRDLKRGAEAGMDERRALGLPYQHIPTNELPDYQRARQVSVEFGETIHESGLFKVTWGNPDPLWKSQVLILSPPGAKALRTFSPSPLNLECDCV
jgi:hypothetical protein